MSPHELVVFSGGTGFNSLCAELKRYTTRVAHVLPVSDDGGSTAEIVRVLGGPAVGDIRSRCLRLADSSSTEAKAVRTLLGHRLAADAAGSQVEWYEVLGGTHGLWRGVSGPYKHTVRSFLAHFHVAVLRASALSDAETPFCFGGGSVGNFFFAGARLFFGSLDAAVFLFSRVAGIPAGSTVLPAVATASRLRLGAELLSGELLRGQSTLSHPCEPGGASPTAVDKGPGSRAAAPLPSPVRRVLYLSTEDTDELHEVFPTANPAIMARLSSADAVVYGIGSLWSSICPSLVAAGVGEAVAQRDVAKVLMLNGSRDRETTGMGVVDVVRAVASSLNRTGGRSPLAHPPRAYVTAVLSPEGGEFDAVACAEELAEMGVATAIRVAASRDDHGRVIFDPASVVAALRSVTEAHRRQLAEKAGYVI